MYCFPHITQKNGSSALLGMRMSRLCLSGSRFADFEAKRYAGSLAGAAFNAHNIALSIQEKEPPPDIGEADILAPFHGTEGKAGHLQQCKLLRINAAAVVFYADNDFFPLPVDINLDFPGDISILLINQTVKDRVLNERLYHVFRYLFGKERIVHVPLQLQPALIHIPLDTDILLDHLDFVFNRIGNFYVVDPQPVLQNINQGGIDRNDIVAAALPCQIIYAVNRIIYKMRVNLSTSRLYLIFCSCFVFSAIISTLFFSCAIILLNE